MAGRRPGPVPRLHARRVVTNPGRSGNPPASGATLRLARRFRCGAGAVEQLDDAAFGGVRDGIGDIAPGTVERPLRHVVLLRDGADLAAVRAVQMPDDLDVLLSGLACQI